MILHDHRTGSTWAGPYTFEHGYLLGLLIGDGVLKKEKAVLSVWSGGGIGTGAMKTEALRYAGTLPHRCDVKGRLEVIGGGESRLALASLRHLAFECGMEPGNKTISPKVEQASSDFYRGFLRGFFDTDGSVQGSFAKGMSVRLAQSDLPRLTPVAFEAVSGFSYDTTKSVIRG